MKELIKSHFPNFNQQLVEEIDKQAIIKSVKAGEVIMRSGQYIKNTVLVISGKVKIYRED
jgi:CRP/FNR family transcriptional regulator